MRCPPGPAVTAEAASGFSLCVVPRGVGAGAQASADEAAGTRR